MTELELSLSYSLGEGWLRPWVDGLRNGMPVGWACDRCARVSFPPVRTCLCGHSEGAWQTVGPVAAIRGRSRGSDGDYALARLQGADTECVFALVGVAESAEQAQIIPVKAGPPKLWLGPLEEELP